MVHELRKRGTSLFGLEIATETRMVLCLRRLRDERNVAGRDKPEKAGNSRIGRTLLCTLGALTAFFVLSGMPQSRAQDGAVPIPRPSPLNAPDSLNPADTGNPANPGAEATPGLSPGALIDPTQNGSARLNFSPDALADPVAARGDRATLGPLAPQPDGPSVGNNPLLGAAPPTAKEVRFHLEARLQVDGEALPSGVTWRVFPGRPDADNRLPLIGEAGGGAIDVHLPPGDYLVHAAYGRAGATKKIKVNPSGGRDTVIINAGGLRLSALVGDNEPLGANDVSFDVYAPDEDGSDERALLVSDAPPDQTIGLNAGVYHVICRYGDANAVVRADIRVEAGKLTEATVYQKAARLTLKLVAAHGGEALANTSWSVVTPEGDRVVESVGAFPSVVLAAGNYTAIASHQGSNYRRDFKVEAGLNRDVEVIAQ